MHARTCLARNEPMHCTGGSTEPTGDDPTMNPAVEDATGTGYTRPRDPIELWLARQWHEVLGFTVGISESFFEIGGNSLDAARVVNAVLDEFGVQLPLNVLTE